MRIGLPVSYVAPEVSIARALDVARGLRHAGHDVVFIGDGASLLLDEAGKSGFAISAEPPPAAGGGGSSFKYVLQGADVAVLIADAYAAGDEGSRVVDLVMTLCPPAMAADVEPFPEQGLICRKRGGLAGVDGLSGPVEDGPNLVRLSERLAEFILCRLGSRRFLEDFQWRDDLRLRSEEFGGLLFIPDTSFLIELDHVTYPLVAASIDGRRTSLLAQYPTDRLDDLAARLYRVGALRRVHAGTRAVA